MIDGVIVTELTTHTDERGFFREILRTSQMVSQARFGQWSHSVMFDGVIKAWHMHRRQTDWWYVVCGVLRVGLCDRRPDSPTYNQTMDLRTGDHQPARMVEIPPGVVHGCKVIQGPAHLIYLTSHEYDPTDELRIAYDDPQIDFDWLAGPPIT